MMRTIICLTTALAFVLHIGMGCCSHHAHAAETVTCQHHITAEHDSHNVAPGGHHHSHAGHDHETQDHERADESNESPTPDSCPAEQCQDGKCVFDTINKIELSQLTNFSLPSFSVNESLDVASVCPTASGFDSGGPLKLPLRLHLLHQVLQI
jgi:hypothetical protein